MTRDEFENLQIGEYVKVTQHGVNKGKIGKIIEKRSYRTVLLEPVECEYILPKGHKNDYDQVYVRENPGTTFMVFNYESLKCLGNSPIFKEKEFYIALMFGEDGISWPTTNFNDKELKVIQRFINELNEHIGGASIESIDIMDKDFE